jgi:hypothetical protein
MLVSIFTTVACRILFKESSVSRGTNRCSSIQRVPDKIINLAELSDNWLLAEQLTDKEICKLALSLANDSKSKQMLHERRI